MRGVHAASGGPEAGCRVEDFSAGEDIVKQIYSASNQDTTVNEKRRGVIEASSGQASGSIPGTAGWIKDKGKKVLVVGGGNSGFEEGLFLTRFASQVDIVEFLPQVKASKTLQDKVAEMQNMSVTVNHAVQQLRVKNGKLDAVVVEDRATGEHKEWCYDGVFVFVGLSPNSDLVKGKAEVDQWGSVITDATLMTSVPGLFTAGDVRAGSTKQAASAAGEGATVALMMRQYLQKNG